MATQYMVLKMPVINNVNIQPSNMVYGMPSIIGIYGFLHNFERHVNFKLEDDFHIHVNKFSILIHDSYYDINAGVSPKMINYMKSEKEDHEASITHTPLARMGMTLIVEIESEYEIYEDDVAHIHLSNICGGTILKQKIELIDNVDHNLLLNTGDFLIDKSYTLKEHDDKLQGMICELGNQGWNVATHIGYAMLEPGIKREGVKGYGEYLHAFAESLTGIATLINKRRIDFSDQQQLLSIWWKYESTDNFLFVRGLNI